MKITLPAKPSKRYGKVNNKNKRTKKNEQFRASSDQQLFYLRKAEPHKLNDFNKLLM